MIHVTIVALAIVAAACGGEEGDDCPSGVRLEGRCLTASDGGLPDASELPEEVLVGGVCDDDGAVVCATDAPRVLQCAGGRYQKVVDCAAGDSCVVLPGGTSARCGLGDAGQPIAVTDSRCAAPGAASCSPDRRALLSCDAGVWRVLEACGAEQACGRTPADTKGPGWSCPGPSACAVCK